MPPVAPDECATLAAREVLGFMKAIAAQVTDGTEPLVLVAGKYSLRGVFNHQQIMAPGNRHDRVAIHALASSPLPPLMVDRPRGIHQDSIQIKKNC